MADGNYDPNFVPDELDYIYVDTNATSDGDGLSPSSPRNVIPSTLADGAQLLFNSDSVNSQLGVPLQQVPTASDDVINLGTNTRTNLRISSYGSGKATVSAFEYFTSGWTNLSGDVYYRSFSGGSSGNGPVVGCVVNFLAPTGLEPYGVPLNWVNLDSNDPTYGDILATYNFANLPANSYGYDYDSQVMYVNLGSGLNPNSTTLGVARNGRFINMYSGSNVTKVALYNLQLLGFCRSCINMQGSGGQWHIYNNYLQAIGGMFNVTNQWYHGSGIQATHTMSDVEIDHNTLVNVYDSPITPQHYGGSSGGHLQNFHIHHNFAQYWALAAVEFADWGSGNQASNMLVEYNTFQYGGQGFSGTGDAGGSGTDCIHTSGTNGDTFNGLTIRYNKLNSHQAGVHSDGYTQQSAIQVYENRIWGCQYGLLNERGTDGEFNSYQNVLCENSIAHVSDASGTHDNYEYDVCPAEYQISWNNNYRRHRGRKNNVAPKPASESKFTKASAAPSAPGTAFKIDFTSSLTPTESQLSMTAQNSPPLGANGLYAAPASTNYAKSVINLANGWTSHTGGNFTEDQMTIPRTGTQAAKIWGNATGSTITSGSTMTVSGNAVPLMYEASLENQFANPTTVCRVQLWNVTKAQIECAYDINFSNAYEPLRPQSFTPVAGGGDAVNGTAYMVYQGNGFYRCVFKATSNSTSNGDVLSIQIQPNRSGLTLAEMHAGDVNLRQNETIITQPVTNSGTSTTRAQGGVYYNNHALPLNNYALVLKFKVMDAFDANEERPLIWISSTPDYTGGSSTGHLVALSESAIVNRKVINGALDEGIYYSIIDPTLNTWTGIQPWDTFTIAVRINSDNTIGMEIWIHGERYARTIEKVNDIQAAGTYVYFGWDGVNYSRCQLVTAEGYNEAD